MSEADSVPSLAEASLAPPQGRRSFLYYRNATFLSLLFGYMGYYLCRQNFSAAYEPMRQGLGIDTVTFGTIASVGTAFYALGKFISGPIADNFGGRRAFLLGLFGSAVASLFFGLASGVALFIVLWAINRLLQSFGWTGLVNVMPRWFAQKHYGTAMGAISISYQFGGVVASLVAGVLLSLGLGWRGLFLGPAIMLLLLGLVLRFFLKQGPEDVGYTPPELPEDSNGQAGDNTLPLRRRLGLLLSQPLFLVVCLLSFALTLLREAFSLWMPAYFTNMGASAPTAAFKSMVFPLLGCVGTLFAGWYSDRISGGRRGPIIMIFLLGLVLSLLGLLELPRAVTFAQHFIHPALDHDVLALIFVASAGFFIFGPYSMVGGGVVALDFGGRGTAATAAGLLDGVGYVGASLAGIGVARVVVAHGWQSAMALLFGITVVSLLLSLPLWRARSS